MRTLLLIILLSTALNTVILPQIVTSSEKERIISELDSLDAWTRYGAINEIKTYKITEAIPKLLENIWIQKEPGIAFNILECLYILDYPNILNLTYTFIDSLNNYDYDLYSAYTPQELKIMAIDILFKKGDYTQAGYFFSFIQSTPNYIQIPRSIGMLGNVLLNDPEYAAQAKTELLKIAFEKTEAPASKYNSQYALLYLQKALGPDIVSVVEQIFQDTSNNFAVRIFCMNILSKEHNNNLADIYKSQLVADTNKVFKITLIKEMLKVLGNPDIVAFIDSYLNNVENDWIKKIVTYQLKDFVPQQDSTLSIEATIDSLISFTNQSYNYNWLKETSYKNELINKLQSAKDYLSSSDSINCAKEIKFFQSSIQKVYSDSIGSYPKYVNQYAYKFLYYYPQYILDRLPPIPSGLPVKLANSTGNNLPGGTLQYYEGGLKNAVDNGNGTFTVDTKLKTISLRMTYENGSQVKSNTTVGTDTVVFQTVNALVKLQDSNGNSIDTGKVQYYAGGWRNFGQTINGTASKELLAANYTFRVSYAFASNDKAQNLDTNHTIIFKTTKTNVELKNSLGNLIDNGTVQYYSGGWRGFGATSNGVASKELLPNNYTFRMSYGFANNDKAQNTGTNPTVVFQTVNTNVELRNSLNNLIDNGTVQYYSGGWREFGATTNGVASKELLPNNYTFRMSYGFANNDKAQNTGTNPTVVFQTVNTKVELRNSLGNLVDQGTVQYYSGGWRSFGTTENGIASKELLANNYTFRMTNEFISNDKQQNIGTNNNVIFQTINCIVRVKNQQSQPVNNARASYYSGGWRIIGNTTNGEINKELLPANLTFRINSGTIQQDKTQNLSSNNLVEFTINQ